MSILSLEDSFKQHIDFERHVCEQLLEISRLIYVEEDPNKNWPSAQSVMGRKSKETSNQVQKEIQNNIDLIRMSVKYMNFDIAA